jgi:hypothetical protein
MISILSIKNYIVLFILIYICIVPKRPVNNKTRNPLLERTTASKAVVPFTYDNNPVSFMESWIQSDEYKNRLQNNQYADPTKTQANRLSSVQKLETNLMDDYPTKGYGSPTPTSKSFININPNDAKKFGYSTVFAHELGHVAGAIPQSTNQNIGFNQVEEDMLRGSNINPSKNAHDRSPEELKADLDSNRFNMFQKGVYDITQGQPFTIEHLNKAKERLKGDTSFDRLLEQTGDDNYIDLMNKIASDKTQTTNMAAYGGLLDPTDQYGFGGFLSGAAKGAGLGAKLGSIIPGVGNVVGAIGGGLIGGLFGNRKENKAQEAEQASQTQQLTQDSKVMFNNLGYGAMQSSNIPMAYGGSSGNSSVPINDYSYFESGGTHESNPHGGIPQGTNANGQLRTVESKEGKFKFTDGDYIFSNRLIFE